MRRRGIIGRLLLSFIFIICFVAMAGADTILFPVIVSNPGTVSTIISVMNKANPSSPFLTYSYNTKFVGNSYSAGCGLDNKIVNTYSGDLVSFDVSGSIGSGGALFNDPDTYTNSFNLPTSAIMRGHLLVSHTDALGTRVDVGSTASLRGEAIIMDIVSGSAWGYKAVNDATREDYTFLPVLDGGGLYNAQLSIGQAGAHAFSFNPLSSWTTKVFVTPIGSNMNSSSLSSIIKLYQPVTFVSGVRGRGTNTYSFDVPVTVTCHAAVSLTDLLDSTAQAALASTGGWGHFSIDSGRSAIVYKLEYTFSSPFVPSGASNNNGIWLSAID